MITGLLYSSISLLTVALGARLYDLWHRINERRWESRMVYHRMIADCRKREIEDIARRVFEEEIAQYVQ